MYLSGNHDGFTRNFTGHSMSKIELADECTHITADNKKMLVLHGDRFDGVICGHIHHAAMREIDGVMYCNDGDWVESCTALVEDYDGQFHLINWAEHKRQLLSNTRLEKQGDTVSV